MTRSEILADSSTSALHDERAACLLLTTDAYAGSDSVKEYHADLADRVSDEIDRRDT
jgi:tryptophanase